MQQLMELDYYFQGWPTDQEAASSTGSTDEALALLAKIRNRRLNTSKRSTP